MSGDYYNRHISAWEPVLEPWRHVTLLVYEWVLILYVCAHHLSLSLSDPPLYPWSMNGCSYYTYVYTISPSLSDSPSLCSLLYRLKLNWEKVPKYSTDLDSNESPDRLYLKLTCKIRILDCVCEIHVHVHNYVDASLQLWIVTW